MYLTVTETAEYLTLPETTIISLILQNRIRAIHDGEQYLIYKEQFNTHFNQLEKMKQQMDEWNAEPLPPDMDVKDED